MKTVKATEMSRIEQLAYKAGAKEDLFMEHAGTGVAMLVRHFIAKHPKEPFITLLCGRGNNAGDAYVAGALLRKGGFTVQALQLTPFDSCSPLCQKMAARFEKEGGKILHPKEPSDIQFGKSSLLVDGIFGTGFHGEVKEMAYELIEKANSSHLPILSIDIPSGIDGNTGEIGNIAIYATQTLFLGLPKTGCFLGDAWERVGKVFLFDFGLGKEFIDQAQEDFLMIDNAMARQMLPPIHRSRHKYQVGYLVGVGGSPSMPGAALLASESALKAGAGIVRLMHPRGMEAELSAAPFELLKEPYESLKEILPHLEKAKALYIGPGMGRSKEAATLLSGLFAALKQPCVIDADALTLIAINQIPPPKGSILTPHKGEMHRLLGIEGQTLPSKELIIRAQDYAEEHDLTLLLKGAPTFILDAHSTPILSFRGDPGMATAGSGDVLTGIIGALLAQGLAPTDAAALGAFLHGVAGEEAAQAETSFSMTARDLTRFLPVAISKLLS